MTDDQIEDDGPEFGPDGSEEVHDGLSTGRGESEEIDAGSQPLGQTYVIKPIRDVADKYVFRFELGPAILRQLVDKFDPVEEVPLSPRINAKYPGFYQLFHKGVPVYIGKTSRPIQARLGEHYGKLSGRTGISMGDLTCRYLFVEDPSLVNVSEGALISFFAAKGMAAWNTSGFGSKVLGSGRGGQRQSKWQEQFQPDVQSQKEAGSDQPVTLYQVIRQVAQKSPLTLSVPNKLKAEFKATHSAPLVIPRQIQSFEQWVNLIESNLADGWTISRSAENWYIEKTDNEQ